jgi:glycosyltransferase involved in cell wall biosynthesis
MPLDTRGDGSALVSLGILAVALARIANGRVSGRLAGVHVNMAERLSLFRKAVVIGWARALGLPVVLHLHAAQLPQFYSGLISPLAWIVRWAFARATRVVVLGVAAQRFVIDELKVPKKRVCIVINGVPQPSVARRLNRDDGAPKRLLFLGNLSERKGVSDLIAAIGKAHVFQTGNAVATFAGSGDIAGYAVKAEAAGIASKVSFVGWADQQKAASLTADADVLVLPSYDEGLPLVILEALANSVAVICTPVGEIPNALVDGKEAVFVKPGDVGALASAIDTVLENPETRRALEKEGRALYEREFSLDQFADSIAEVHRMCFGVASRLLAAQRSVAAK